MSKVIKSGKLDNVIASMDAGKHYIVKMRDGTVTAVEKTGLPEKIGMCLGNGCFIAGTLVTTRSGFKPIEEIVIGDYVLSRNEETGEDSYKKVIDTLVRSTQEICTIELENGKIKSTTGHLFMVKDKWWKAAVELVAGDILVTSDRKEQVVKSIKIEEKGYPVTTYNLTVEDNHTFFVSDKGVLTHNMNNVLKGCNFDTEVSEKLSKGVSKAEINIAEGIEDGVKKAKFKYKNNPMDNPKAARDIIENSDAVYGFSPNPDSTRIGKFANKIDWTDPQQVEIAKQTRLEYHVNNEQMLDNLYKQGYSTEDIARKMVNGRNANRLNSYLEKGDMEGYEIARKSNIDTYQNANGPTPELMLKKYGSWEDVINASVSSNPGMDACVGLYDKYHGGK